MATLYVTEPGARIEKEHGRVLVTKDDEVLSAVPLSQVTEVVLVGAAGATTPALLALLDNSVSLSIVTTQGKLRGRLRAAEANNIALRRQQYARTAEPTFAREMGRAIVTGKLKNCRTLARRLQRGGEILNPKIQDPHPPTAFPDPQSEIPKSEIERINAALAALPTAPDLDTVRGLEGTGSQAYFAVLRAAVRGRLAFAARTRRPPRDPVNALLSFAYTLLTNVLFTACEVAGLDPYAGCLHADKYGRPALALDLMEEFRPIVADSVVLTVVNNRMLEEKDFETDAQGGVWLSKRGRRAFLAQFTRRLNTEVFHPDAGRPLSYQKVFEVQARRWRKCVENGEANYLAFLAK